MRTSPTERAQLEENKSELTCNYVFTRFERPVSNLLEVKLSTTRGSTTRSIITDRITVVGNAMASVRLDLQVTPVSFSHALGLKSHSFSH